MNRVRNWVSKLIIASLVLLPFDVSWAMVSQTTPTTIVTPTQTPASTDLPFTLESVLGKDGSVQTTFRYVGAATNTQRVELIVNKPGSKAAVFEGKFNGNQQELQITGLTPGETYSYNVRVTDKRSDKSPKVKQDTYTATDSYAGDFTIRVKQAGAGAIQDVHLQMGEVAKNGSFDISAGEAAAFLTTYESESNNSFASANTIIAGDDLYGMISSSTDTDYFKVKFYTTGTTNLWLGSIPPGCDYDLYVYDQNFNQVGASLYGGNYDEVISGLSVTANQTYYVKVVGYNGTFNTNQYYSLHASNSTAVTANADSYESNGTFDTATSIGNNDWIYANLPTTTDVDYYRFYVPLRSTFSLGLSNIPSGNDYDVQVYDANQNWVAASLHASNTDEAIDVTLNPGYYYVKVYPYSGSSISDYTLSLNTNTIPVILLPGIGGSQLNANGSLTWFNLWDALAINIPLKNNLSLDPACAGCTDVVPHTAGTTIAPNTNNYGLDGIEYLSSVHLGATDYFKNLINDLKTAGYVPGQTLFGFPYDWRLDNRYQHSLLTTKINDALSASGASKVQLVAHSMGGLVAKDYMLTDSAMTSNIDQVVTVGTPFLGAAMATKAVGLGGYNFGVPILFDSTGYAIAKNAPAVYQLAPSQEYENQVQATLGRPTYRYINISGVKTDYTHAQLTAKYPNQALVGQADSRHSQWDNSYPGVQQYHIVSDGQSTVSAFNYWEMKDLFHWYYLEYVMSKGDGTVPLFSATKPGTSGTGFYYSTADHTGMVKDAATRAQILKLLKGDTASPASGIRTAASTAAMTELTANSLTSDQVSFNNMTIQLTNNKTGMTEYVKFRSDGTLDYENSTASLMPQLAQLDDGTYNVQFFINKYDSYNITVNSTDNTQFIVAKYDLSDAGADNRVTFGQLTNTASAPITIAQQSGVTTLSQGGQTITGTSFTLN